LPLLQSLIFPPRCLLCGAPGYSGMDLCCNCFIELPSNSCACRQCGENLPAVSGSEICGDCLNNPPAFDETHAPYRYLEVMPYLVSQLKFRGQLAYARLLGQLLARQLLNARRPDCIMPVPLHLSRYRERGFNQSIEIGRFISKALQLPLSLHDCIRQQRTQHQTELTATQRQKNLQQAFAVSRPFAYKQVAILDDVMTTGATADALARILKQQGVENVSVWVCCRA